MTAPAIRRIDLSPAEYVHVPQAPRIERRVFLARGADNPWQMRVACGVTLDGAATGVSNHTWSHVDAPFHRLADGATLDRVPPAHYLASRTRVIDLTPGAAQRTGSAPTGPKATSPKATSPTATSAETPEAAAARHETIDGVTYHSAIDAADLPDDLDGFDAVLCVTGFGALIDRGYPMTADADWHYPSLTAAAAARLAALPSLRLVAMDSPTVDKPDADGVAHVTLLGRAPSPVLLVESLTCERLRRAAAAAGSALPREALLTVEPLRAFGPEPDGALASVYLYYAAPGGEAGFADFARVMIGAARESGERNGA